MTEKEGLEICKHPSGFSSEARSLALEKANDILSRLNLCRNCVYYDRGYCCNLRNPDGSRFSVSKTDFCSLGMPK